MTVGEDMAGRTAGTETKTQVGGEKVEGDVRCQLSGCLVGRDGDAMMECLFQTKWSRGWKATGWLSW